MDAVSGDRLVSEYLSRLHAAAWVLPVARRTALVDRTRLSLQDLLGDSPDAAATKAALAALGPPEELVREEARTVGPVPVPPPRPVSLWGGREVAAVLLLAVGGLALPVVGPVVGLVLAWLSDRWSVAERAVATLLAVLPLVLLGLPSLLVTESRAEVLLVVLLVPLAGLVPAAYLGIVLQRRQAAARPVHDAASTG